MKYLVIGLPGSGKTSFVKQRMQEGLCFDLDYVAAAFRLKGPHEERHTGSRRMANSLMTGFSLNAEEYTSGDIFIIRTAPDLCEIEEIDPDGIAVCTGEYDISGRADYRNGNRHDMEMRIRLAIDWANRNGVKIINP